MKFKILLTIIAVWLAAFTWAISAKAAPVLQYSPSGYARITDVERDCQVSFVPGANPDAVGFTYLILAGEMTVEEYRAAMLDIFPTAAHEIDQFLVFCKFVEEGRPA